MNAVQETIFNHLHNNNNGRTPIVQPWGDNAFYVQSDTAFNEPVQFGFSDYGMWASNMRFNFYEYYAFTRTIGQHMAYKWLMEKADRHNSIDKWAGEKAARFAGKAIHKEWQKHLKTVAPEVLNLHKAVFVANFGRSADGMGLRLEVVPEIYDNHYLIRDVTCNRAAAIVFANLDPIIRGHCRVIHVPPVAEGKTTERIAARVLEDKWDSWPALLSDTAQPYTSLTRTLSNLPGRITGTLLASLQYVHLERPMTSRRELIALLMYAQIYANYLEGQTRPPNHTRLFHHATSAQIAKAIALVSSHTHTSLNPDKIKDQADWIMFLMDYPEPHDGNVIGLTKKAIRWHIHEQQAEREKMISEYGGKQKLGRPRTPLPDDERIKFISTIDELAAESEYMGHCVASYARHAKDGWCYLFHVEYQEEHATVEVSPYGEIRQAQGPKNTKNKAVTWGRRKLAEWGKTIPSNETPILYPTCRPDPVTEVKTVELSMPSPFLETNTITYNRTPWMEVL